MYRGRVSNVLEFGCFVELQGFRKKAEGLVHTSNISKQRWVPQHHNPVSKRYLCDGMSMGFLQL